jgi:hypothetical protein
MIQSCLFEPRDAAIQRPSPLFISPRLTPPRPYHALWVTALPFPASSRLPLHQYMYNDRGSPNSSHSTPCHCQSVPARRTGFPLVPTTSHCRLSKDYLPPFLSLSESLSRQCSLPGQCVAFLRCFLCPRAHCLSLSAFFVTRISCPLDAASRPLPTSFALTATAYSPTLPVRPPRFSGDRHCRILQSAV